MLLLGAVEFIFMYLSSIFIPLGRTMAVQAVRNVGRLAANSSFFFLCDMQEQFRSTIKYYPEIITVANKMVNFVFRVL